MFIFAKREWKKIADEIIEHFKTWENKPGHNQIRNMINEKWRYKNKVLPATINKISFLSRILTRVKAELEAHPFNNNSPGHFVTEGKILTIPAGSIVDKYRTYIIDYAEKTNQQHSFNDLILNHFELKSYNEIAYERGVAKNTISSNIERSKRELHKISNSGTMWEQAIFAYMLEQLEKEAQKNNYSVLKFVNERLVEAFPDKRKEDVFTIVVNRLTPPIDLGSITADVQSLLANPLLFSLSSFSSPFLFFSWFGSLSSLDFLFLSPFSVFLFDAKVSHLTRCSNSKPYLSHTVSHEDLGVQTTFYEQLQDKLDHKTLSASLLFWSPFIHSRFVSHRPGESVTINKKSLSLEPQLQKIITEEIEKLTTRPQEKNSGRPTTIQKEQKEKNKGKGKGSPEKEEKERKK